MQAMKARPDGYTITTLTYDSVITVPFQKLLPGYSMDKLAFVARITSEPDAIIVSKDAPYKTLDDLVKAAKASPGTVKVAIQEIGSRTHPLGRASCRERVCPVRLVLSGRRLIKKTRIH